MGIEDRDYFQEDRARREKMYGSGYNKKDVRSHYYNPKEFRRNGDYKKANKELLVKKQLSVMMWFCLGGFITLWIIMIILNLNANMLWIPFEATRRALEAVGAM